MTAFRFSFRRHVAGGLLIVAVTVLAGMQLRGKTVQGYPVERRDLLQTVVTTGRVTSLARVDVGSQLLGSVAMVYVDSGDRVKAGDLLIRLRDEEARAALEQAQAVVRELEERLAQIGSVDGPVSRQKLAEAEATLRHALNSYERVKKLFDSGIYSRADLDEAVRARDVAAGAVEREKLQLSNSHPQGGDIKQARARLAQARAAVDVAREKLSRTLITAPGDGTVIARKVEKGDVVQAGVSLLVLSRSGRTQITAQVDEKNLGLLRVGQTAVSSADAYPDKTFPAGLATVVPAVDPQRGTFEVRFDVADAPAYLVPDMTVSVEIEVARHPKVLTVPSETVRDASTAPWVLVAHEGRAERRNIVLGIRGSGESEVLSGLTEGETVLADADKVAIGSRISLQSASSNTKPGVKNSAH
ncbi:macrolide export protein MacA [Geobacter sp. OR-1]|uniref:efflux RND transporter periplasmic adaptor subunit n=1 Tax=Geobacter sp. OR-1 TaxID=1266765 RepID=UPI0005433BC0|nr:efflux RND transporter periplasmic adaptor subunit [Geobacter sp. OR-1]GAM08038.1 macrolide export protein MacA [Geobacter sp. OR-1]